MIFKKKTAALFSAVLAVAAISITFLRAGEYISAGTQPAHRERQVIILDAGHAEQTKPYKLPNGKINIL